MKKKLLATLSISVCLGITLAGCATVSDVKVDGKNVYFDDAKYYGGQVVAVGDYIYFGNAYFDSTETTFSYNESSKTAYLSRVKAEDLTFDSEVLVANKKHTTPKEAEKVIGGKVAGFQSQNMVALGEYIYFTAPNAHQDKNLKNDYTKLSLFRVKFNGDNLTEILDVIDNSDGCKLSLVKADSGKYYYVFAEKAADEDKGGFDISAIEVGDSIGKVKSLVKNAQSYVFPDENSTTKSVIYTVDAEKTQSTICVKSIDIDTSEEKTLDEGVVASTTKLIDRLGDIIFYSYSYNKIEEVYFKDMTGDNLFYPTTSQKFYSATSISEIRKVGEGYIFTATSGSIMFKTLDAQNEAVLVSKTENFSDILFVDGNYVYLSTSSSILRIDITDNLKTLQTVATADNIISGQYGYADEYIYFYAQRGKLEVDEDVEEESESEEDGNYYMYRTDKAGNIQLVAITK